MGLGGLQNSSQVRPTGVVVDVEAQRRQLERHIAIQTPLRDLVDQAKVGIAHRRGFGGRRDVLAQVIQRNMRAFGIELRRRLKRLHGGFAGHKTPRNRTRKPAAHHLPTQRAIVGRPQNTVPHQHTSTPLLITASDVHSKAYCTSASGSQMLCHDQPFTGKEKQGNAWSPAISIPKQA